MYVNRETFGNRLLLLCVWQLKGGAGHLLDDEHAVWVGHAQPVLNLLPRHALPVLGQAPAVQPSLQRSQSLHIKRDFKFQIKKNTSFGSWHAERVEGHAAQYKA